MGRYALLIVGAAGALALPGGAMRGDTPTDGKATERWPDGKVKAVGKF